MKEHHVTWYESEDGEIFVDDLDCMCYEAMILYDQSGVRFYRHDWSEVEFKAEDDYTYNECDFVAIDRRNKNNKRFVDYMNDNFGWCLLKEAYDDMDGDTFALKMSKVIPVSSHLVY